jgi:DNA topoisomerase I
MVESSIGHIRDLPSKADEIPAQYKGKSWARTGVDVENDFSPLYIVPPQKKAQVQKLKNLLADASVLYLATDEDREGEAIAWHLKEVLKPKVPVKRMVFHEITEAAIRSALAKPRAIDEQLVNAQEARRILDRLYGYEVSPILWRKVAPRLSAGRVQSVATRLIVERERLRIAFHKGTYWDIAAELEKDPKTPEIRTELVEIDERRVARGSDFDPNTGKLAPGSKALLLDEQRAKNLESALVKTPFVVKDVQKKPFTQKPSAPFTTSTLQQESGRKLRYTAQRTMRIAQRLYENGFITYMRTDSTSLSEQAVNAARSQIESMYGKPFLPDNPRTYSTKAKGAQEAHEAIRPAGESFRTPESVRGELEEEAFKLYELIWKRTVASQMNDAYGQRTQVRFDAKTADGVCAFQTSGKVIQFAGFLRAYVEGSDDPDAELEEQERILPPLAVGDILQPRSVKANGHETQPPARFTEASLVKELEDRGIGRPSTYASIIGTIQDRGYVFKKGTALVPTFTAFAVINLLETHFGELVDYTFTATMENDLDAISEGQKDAKPWLKHFYFGEGKKPKAGTKTTLDQVGLKAKVEDGVDDIDARGICEMPLGKNDAGDLVAARVGRYGPYVQIGDTDKRANIPEDTAPDELTMLKALALITSAGEANRPLGTDPASKKAIYLKSGRFGPYVMLGEMELNDKGKAKGIKPRMASLWPGMVPTSLSLDEALLILSFPKTLGVHPENGLDVVLYDGKFGPYVMVQGTTKAGADVKETRSLPDRVLMTTLSLQQAIDLLNQPRQPRGRQSVAQPPLASLGTSPTTKQAIVIKTGKFGAYVTDGQVNATIPSSRDPARVTFDDALEFIAAREAKMREQGLDPRPAAKPAKIAKAKAPAAKAPVAKAAKKASKAAPKKAKAAPKKAAKTVTKPKAQKG